MDSLATKGLRSKFPKRLSSFATEDKMPLFWDEKRFDPGERSGNSNDDMLRLSATSCNWHKKSGSHSLAARGWPQLDTFLKFKWLKKQSSEMQKSKQQSENYMRLPPPLYKFQDLCQAVNSDYLQCCNFAMKFLLL
jgi:hypothetical protein